MALTIHAHPGYDHRDDPNTTRGAAGLILTMAVIEPGAWAISLEILTGWMARPLVRDRVIPGGPQQRHRTPGTDGLYRRDLLAAVHICVPLDAAAAPDYFIRGRATGDCPHLGVPCRGDTGHLMGDDGLVVLLDGGEPALETWLRERAEQWLEVGANA